MNPFLSEKVKRVRVEFLNSYNPKECSSRTLIDDDEKILNLFQLYKELNISNPELNINEYNYKMYEEQTKNLSIDEINFAGEMFTALNLCPSNFARIYTKIMVNGTVSKILKISNKIMKHAALDFKPKATKIFSKILSVLNFQYISFDGDVKNKNIGETMIKRNTSNVRGR